MQYTDLLDDDDRVPYGRRQPSTSVRRRHPRTDGPGSAVTVTLEIVSKKVKVAHTRLPNVGFRS